MSMFADRTITLDLDGNSLGNTMRCGQHPLGSDQGAAAEVLVQGINQRHLPTPLGRVRVFATDHS